MPIKWSAVKVNQACDDVEAQLNLAEQFFAEAKKKAEEARKLSNLPQYIDQKLANLKFELESRIESLKIRVDSIREQIPEGEKETEREGTKYGNQQSII